MNFSSPLFLFAFLPIILIIYRVVSDRWRPLFFTISSLVFCFWAGPLLFPVILVSTLVNFITGNTIQRRRNAGISFKWELIGGIAFNIILMLGFKFLVAYGPSWINQMSAASSFSAIARLQPYLLKSIGLPVGISFYSFQAIAYLLDISAGRTTSESSLSKFTEYMTAFPKVVAGPITRYRHIADQLGKRPFDTFLAATGVNRFIIGLAKKTLIADRFSLLIDHGVFDRSLPDLSMPNAWLVLICYTLQIYFDFSGYSDMAIGLGMIFGLTFPENFNFPYSASSISDFWRRWHMTLSAWFREVLFFPLERKRTAGSRIWNTYTNTILVFFLTGLWHGVTINFLIWGLLHGLAICFENSPAGKILRKAPAMIRHLYTLLLVMIGWVFFRSNSPAFAVAFLQNLVGINTGTGLTPYSVLPPTTPSLWITLALAAVFAFPTVDRVMSALKWKTAFDNNWLPAVLSLILLAVSIIVVAGSTFQPYIYGNF